MLTHCLTLLRAKGIRYSHSIHPNAYTAASVADAERIPAGEMVKTVVYRGDNGFGMLLLPADRIVDFPQARRVLGLTSMSLADERELTELFPDSEVGAMPPFGNAFEFPVLMDETITDMKFVAFTAGTHRDVIRMSVEDFRRLVKPQIASFAFKEVTA